jgi:hypothetical protein
LSGRGYGRQVLAIRVVLAAVGIALLHWAYAILSNIWTYNDSGTPAYIVFALVPGVPGLLCVYLALRWSRHPLRRQ